MPKKKQRKGWNSPVELELATLNVLVQDYWSDEIPLNELPDELLSIFRDYEQSKCELPPLAQGLYQRIKRRNGGVLPKVVGGRPRRQHEELLIASKVGEALAAQTSAGERKNVSKASQEVHRKHREDEDKDNRKRPLLSVSTIRNIYNRYRTDPELRRALERTMKDRASPLTKPEPAAEPPVMVQDIPKEFYEAGLPSERKELSEEDYRWWLQAARDQRESRDRRARAPRVISRPRRMPRKRRGCF